MFLFRWCFPYAEATSLRRVCVCPGPSPRTTPCATGACCRGRGSTAAASAGEAPPASTNLQVSSTEYWLTNHKQGKLVRHTDQPINSEENLYEILAYQSWARKNSRYSILTNQSAARENLYEILTNQSAARKTCTEYWPMANQSAARKTCTEYCPANQQQAKLVRNIGPLIISKENRNHGKVWIQLSLKELSIIIFAP